MRFRTAYLGILLLPLLAACTGPKGDAGPMGPSGNATPIYYYNNSFDSGGVSAWQFYNSGGAGIVQAYFDASMFVSPSQCLGVSTTGLTGLDSLAYISVPVSTAIDSWTEFDWNMEGAVAGGYEFFEFLGGSTKRVVIGFDSINLYLVQGAGQVDVAPQPSATAWHHVVIKVAGVTEKASYWMDGLTLGTDYTTNETIQGSPPSGFLMGISNHAAPGSVTHIDNLQCYHY